LAHRRTIIIKRLRCADVLCRQQQPKIRLKVSVHSTVTGYVLLRNSDGDKLQSPVTRLGYKVAVSLAGLHQMHTAFCHNFSSDTEMHPLQLFFKAQRKAFSWAIAKFLEQQL